MDLGREIVVVVFALCAGCLGVGSSEGDHGDADSDADSDTDSGSGTDTSTDTGSDTGSETSSTSDLDIPEPGPIEVLCQDREPNDVPNDAQPCGTIPTDPGHPLGGSGVYIFGAEFTDGDAFDYYVFRTGPGVVELHEFANWGGGGDLLDFVLYEVLDDGARIEERIRYATETPNIENAEQERFPVTENTVYLLEVIAKGVGPYSF